MSLTKTEVATSDFIKTGSKEQSKDNGKRVALKVADQIGTLSLLWLLVKRHKVAILAAGNIVLVLNWAFPEWPQLVLGLIGK